MISDKIIQKLYWHAEQCYPNECCGFIRNTSSGPDVITSSNTHADPRNHFSMPVELFIAHSVGAICMYHSHPDGAARPSVGDINNYRRTGIPQLILNWPQGHMSVYGRLCHGLYGRPFIYGVYDCYSLVRSYYAEIHGVELHDYVRPRFGWWDGEDDDPLLSYYHHAGFAIINDKPMTGDVILMRIAGARKPNHVGVILEDSRLLHHRLNALSGRTLYENYYRKNTVAVLRYAN